MSAASTVMGRVARLRDLMGERGYDACVLRANADLRWLTGAERVFDDEVAHVAFITADGLWLHTDSRYLNAFVGRMGADGPWKLDQDVVSPEAWVARRALETRSRVIAIEDSVELGFYDNLQVELSRAGLAPALARLHSDIRELRIIKDETELELLREAQRITDDAFDHICGYIEPGLTEKQIRAELEGYMLSHGADGLSFSSIVAAGPNGANPHAQPGDYAVRSGDMIVLDYGALFCDYHADMTRTVCVGRPSDKQREVYDVVRRAHEECAAAVHAGVNGREIHELSVRIISEAGYGEYYGHGLGHGVGIEIHELPGFSVRWDKEVVAGSVVTIEPGIYLPGEFGIRLEDCGLVTDAGYEPFTASSHELACV